VHALELAGEVVLGAEVLGAAGEGVGENVVDEGGVVEAGDPGHGEEGDVGVGEALAQGGECGDAHDGVTNPVGGANEDAAKLHAL